MCGEHLHGAAGRALVLAIALTSSSALAQPAITRPVTDDAHVLSSAAVRDIEARLTAHHDAGHAQIALLLVRTTAGTPITDYSMRAAEEWGGGTRGVDDGLLFVLAVDDHEMRIEVGYGLEPVITDGVAMQILDGLIPTLREGDFDRAAWAVSDALVARTGGSREPVPEWPSVAPPEPGSTRGEPIEGAAEKGWVEERYDLERHDADPAPLLFFVLAIALTVLFAFAYLWRSSNIEYDRDGVAHTPWREFPVKPIIAGGVGVVVIGVALVATASGWSWFFVFFAAVLVWIVGNSLLGGGAGSSGSGRSSESSSRSTQWESHGTGSFSGSSSHRSSSHHSSSGSSSYGGGGGGFGGGGASKRW